MTITQKTLSEMLTYHPDEGCFTWNVQVGRAKPGDVAGCVTHNGYIQIRIMRQSFLAHRLAFLYMTGELPNEVDHIDHNRQNNRWSNLTAANRKSNQRNQSLFVTNKSGYPGVRFEDGKWRAKISTKHIGRFDSFDEAVKAKKEAESKHNYHKNHGLIQT